MSVRGVLNREAGVHPVPGPLLAVLQSGGTDRCPGFCLSVRLGRLLALAPAQVADTPSRRRTSERANESEPPKKARVARCSQRRPIPIVRLRQLADPAEFPATGPSRATDAAAISRWYSAIDTSARRGVCSPALKRRGNLCVKRESQKLRVMGIKYDILLITAARMCRRGEQ